MKHISIIDYGFGNFRAVGRMLDKIGLHAEVALTPKNLRKGDALILPGVGSYDAAAQKLRTSGWEEKIKDIAREGETLLIGICLGAQLLGTSSEEGSENGLGLLEFEVKKLPRKGPIPNMGWLSTEYKPEVTEKFKLPREGRYYFAHSFFMDAPASLTLGLANFHGFNFPSAVGKAAILGFQFHPEKSHSHGLDLLTRVLG